MIAFFSTPGIEEFTGRHEQNRVGGPYRRLEVDDRLWRPSGEVVIEEWEIFDVEGVDADAGGRKFLRRPQRRPVVGAFPQTPGDAKDTEVVGHDPTRSSVYRYAGENISVVNRTPCRPDARQSIGR